MGDPGLIPELGRFPQGREWLPTPVFWPGESHGQRNLVGYIRGGHRGSDMMGQLTLSLSLGGQDTVKVGKGLFLSVGLGLPRLLSELAQESRWRLM